MNDEQTLTNEQLTVKIAALELQVQKLDRLVYKLFQKLPHPAHEKYGATRSGRE